MDVEIVKVENGFLILEGNAYSQNNPYLRKKWVAKDITDLCVTIKDIYRPAQPEEE